MAIRFRVTVFDLQNDACKFGDLRWGTPIDLPIESLRKLLDQDFFATENGSNAPASHALNVDLIITTRQTSQFSEIAGLLTPANLPVESK